MEYIKLMFKCKGFIAFGKKYEAIMDYLGLVPIMEG